MISSLQRSKPAPVGLLSSFVQRQASNGERSPSEEMSAEAAESAKEELEEERRVQALRRGSSGSLRDLIRSKMRRNSASTRNKLEQMQRLMLKRKGTTLADLRKYTLELERFAKKERSGRSEDEETRDEMQRVREMLEEMKDALFFESLTESQMAVLMSDCAFKQYEPGEVVVREKERCLALFVLVQGGIGEYKGIEELGASPIADPIRLYSKRVKLLDQPLDQFCSLSLFLGSPSKATYAAVYPSQVFKIPASAIQPLIINDPAFVKKVANFLLSDPDLEHSNLSNMGLTTSIYRFHAELSMVQPGISWEMSPRSRLKEPRAMIKTIREKEGEEVEEIAPCVGLKKMVSSPYRQDTRRSHRSMEQTEGETHLSPRLTLRDISRGTCSFTRSSRRAEGDTRSTSRGIAIGSDPESWREQEKFEEKPLVTMPGSGYFFPRCFDSRGGTRETLEELSSLQEMNRSSATRFSRNMRLWVADNKSKGKPHISYQQRKRWESRESNIREQMQFEQVSPSLSAFRCASPTRQEEPDETHFKSKQQGEEKRPSLVTFECKERHSFQVANLQDVFQHVQYEKPSNEQADKHDLTTKEVVRFDDERMKDKFSVFPLRQTMTMLRSSPYLLKKEVGILSSHSPSSPSRSAQRNIRYPDSLLPEAQPAAWNSSLRVADTTGLIGEEEQQQLHVTFTCQTRREFPFSFANGRTDPKASHTFTDLIRLGASTPTPSSVSREAQAQGVQRGGSPTAPGSPGFKTWQNEVKREYHESEMFSAMSSQSTSGFRIARRTDRKSWDGGSANSRAPEEEEVGKPMVRTPEVTKTRQHVHEDLNLNPSFSAPRPTWVCLERHKQHAH